MSLQRANGSKPLEMGHLHDGPLAGKVVALAQEKFEVKYQLTLDSPQTRVGHYARTEETCEGPGHCWHWRKGYANR